MSSETQINTLSLYYLMYIVYCMLMFNVEYRVFCEILEILHIYQDCDFDLWLVL